MYFLCPTVRVVDALSLNLENKARSYETPNLAAVFLLNNFQFIHKTFTRYVLFMVCYSSFMQDLIVRHV